MIGLGYFLWKSRFSTIHFQDFEYISKFWFHTILFPDYWSKFHKTKTHISLHFALRAFSMMQDWLCIFMSQVERIQFKVSVKYCNYCCFSLEKIQKRWTTVKRILNVISDCCRPINSGTRCSIIQTVLDMPWVMVNAL